MAKRYKLLKAWPSLPTGSIIIQDGDGLFWDSDHATWFSQECIDSTPGGFQDPWIPAVGEIYWYVTDMGTVGSAIFDGSDQSARIAVGNFYSSEDAANVALQILASTLTMTS